MNEWTSRIQDHRIWGVMQMLGPSIDQAVRLDEIEPAAVEALERLRSVLAFCGKRLGGGDPLTIPPASLDSLAGALESQQTEINAFISDRNVAHLTNANTSADTLLVALAQVPSVSSPEELVGLIQAANAHRAVIDELMQSSATSRKQATAEILELRATLDKLKSQTETTAAEIRSQLDIERQKISSQLSEQQKLFADAQENRGNTYSDTVRKIQETLTQTLSDQQGQFSAAQENRNREFTAAQTESQKRFGDLIADYTKRLADQNAEFTTQRDGFVADAQGHLSELHDAYKNNADEIIEKVNKRREEIETLVGVIGNLGVTSGYQKTANQAKRSMWLWQVVAVLAMVMVIFFAYRAFLPTIHGQFEWQGFAARVFLTITVGVLAAYAATQADRFFQMERYNRKLALELAAIDPFIALLPLDEQYKFKLEIGRRSFAQDEVTKHGKSPATTLDIVLKSKDVQKQLLDIILEAIRKLPKVG